MKLILAILIYYQIKLSLSQFIDNPIIYSGNLDPTPKLLPKNWLDNFVQNTKPVIQFENNSTNNINKRKHTFKEALPLHGCRDPNENKLGKLLMQLYNNNYDINFIVNKIFNSFKSFNQSKEYKTFDLLNSLKNHETKVISIHGSSDCVQSQMSIIDNHTPLCPWHYNLIERKNRFPFKRLSAVCNCKNCLNSMNGSKCVSISLPMPMLIRGKCHNGVYEWNSAIENVPSSCVCILI